MGGKLEQIDYNRINKSGQQDYGMSDLIDSLVESFDSKWSNEDAVTLKAMETLMDNTNNFITDQQYEQAIGVLNKLNSGLNKKVSRNIGSIYISSVESLQDAMKSNTMLIENLNNTQESINKLSRSHEYSTEDVQNILNILTDEAKQYLPNAQANVTKAYKAKKEHLAGMIDLLGDLSLYDIDSKTKGNQVFNSHHRAAQDYMLLGDVNKAHTAYKQGQAAEETNMKKTYSDTFQEMAKNFKLIKSDKDNENSNVAKNLASDGFDFFEAVDSDLYYDQINNYMDRLHGNFRVLLEGADVDWHLWDNEFGDSADNTDPKKIYDVMLEEIKEYNLSNPDATISLNDTDKLIELMNDNINFKGMNIGDNEESVKTKLFVQQVQLYDHLLKTGVAYGYAAQSGAYRLTPIQGL